jgi:hypothetical protein
LPGRGGIGSHASGAMHEDQTDENRRTKRSGGSHGDVLTEAMAARGTVPFGMDRDTRKRSSHYQPLAASGNEI